MTRARAQARRKLLPNHMLAFQEKAQQARDGEAGEKAKPDKPKNTKVKSSRCDQPSDPQGSPVRWSHD